MATYRSVQITMTYENGQPVARFTAIVGSGDVASGVCDRTMAMQLVNQFYPTDVSLYAQAFAQAANSASSASQTVSTTVAAPGVGTKVGL